MVEKLHIISNEERINTFFDEKELLNRAQELKNKTVKPLSREEVFDGIC
jgi:hypothetical protein